jgi:anti-sigma regulatory factor (Ser/Thr protein kinase)
MDRHVDGISLPALPESVRRARAFVAETVRRAGVGQESLEVIVVASELVTNAVVHGAARISLRTVIDADNVWIEVQDHGPDLPVRIDPHEPRDSGRGLAIVEEFAGEWGCTVVRGASGKFVWCSVPRVPDV